MNHYWFSLRLLHAPVHQRISINCFSDFIRNIVHTKRLKIYNFIFEGLEPVVKGTSSDSVFRVRISHVEDRILQEITVSRLIFKILSFACKSGTIKGLVLVKMLAIL